MRRLGRYRIHALHSGSGPDLVLLHGLSGSSRWWRYNVPVLAKQFRTHTPDLVGFGRSRAWVTQPTISDMAAILAEWMEVSTIDRAHVIGHSMGGQIAIHLAVDAPQRVHRLVLVSTAGIPRELTLGAVTRFIAEIVPPRAWGAPAFLPTVAADALRMGPRVFFSATSHVLRDDVRPLLPRILAPTLLIWGRLDPLTPLAHGEYMANHIPDARLIVFDDAAHMPMVDAADPFNDLIVSFLGQGQD